MTRLMDSIFFFGVALAFLELYLTSGTQRQANLSTSDTIEDYLLTWSPKWKRPNFVTKTSEEARTKKSVLRKFHNYLITLRSSKVPHLSGLRSPSTFHQNSMVR
ncbi:uncharacterized protein LOC143258094 [Tachypleus tridentatus]|uniref:uncharacterized protein LOC143258094 n=1 Tax=Tachypleus tridentatus TaxID=6853 RepID=UPI003FD4187C